MCWSATYRLIMQCFGFAVPEVSTESLLIDQPPVRSDTDDHRPIDGLSLRMEGGGMGMVSQSVRQPMETASAALLPESDRPAAAATSFNTSPLLQPTAVSPATAQHDQLEPAPYAFHSSPHPPPPSLMTSLSRSGPSSPELGEPSPAVADRLLTRSVQRHVQ